jgi:hypothetical protein
MMKAFLISVTVALLSGMPVWAADVTERIQPSALSFTGGASFTGARLQIFGPDDFEAEETASRGLPVFRVRGGQLSDGIYRYFLSAATDEKVPMTRKVDNGRGENARDFNYKPFYKEGAFRISRGLIEALDQSAEEEEEG